MKYYVAKKPLMVAGISYIAGNKIPQRNFDPVRIPTLLERGVIEDPDELDEINKVVIRILSENDKNIGKLVPYETVSTVMYLLQHESAECIKKINELEDPETLILLSLVEHRKDVQEAIDLRISALSDPIELTEDDEVLSEEPEENFLDILEPEEQEETDVTKQAESVVDAAEVKTAKSRKSKK